MDLFKARELPALVIGTVHDSIIGEIHPDEDIAWHEIGEQCFIKDSYMLLDKLYNVKLSVPLGAGVMLGSHWANGPAKRGETVYEADPDLYIEAAYEGGMI